MLLSRFIVSIFFTGLISAGADIVSGQDYPNKPIRIVTQVPGGGSDFAARLIGQGLASNLKQPVIVDNRGGSVIVPAEIVAKSPPDGYTLLLYSGTFYILPLMQDVPYDPVKDFAPIILAVSSPVILVVHPSVAASSAKELIALAKARPGQLNYGSGGPGGSPHLAAELFKSMVGVKIVGINYKGAGPALNALIGGEVQVMFSTAGALGPYLKSGRLKALAVTSAQPSALFPGLPTMAAAGVPGYESVTRTGLFAPAKTPVPLINRLNREITVVLNKPDTKEKFLASGVETVGSTPEQFAAAIKSEMVVLGKVIKEAGIRAE